MYGRPYPVAKMPADFSARLTLMMKALAVSRGQLASALAVDKSIVSRWLSGATVPSDHNLARLTAYFAESVPGFNMLDWERDNDALAARIGLPPDAPPPHAAEAASVASPLADPPSAAIEAAGAIDLPGFETLPAFVGAYHESAARGDRYCGLWQSWMPTVGRPDAFHCEHTVIRRQGVWLAGIALGISYRWPLTGFIANGQLLLVMSDANDFIFRQFNRADEPIVEQVDGLMLAAASLKHQAPTACRVVMSRLLPAEADDRDIEEELHARRAERQLVKADGLPAGMAADLLPDFGPAAAQAGGERLLRADPSQRLVRTRWY